MATSSRAEIDEVMCTCNGEISKRCQIANARAQAHLIVSQTFKSHITKSLQWRIEQLRKTWWMIEDNKQRIVAALHHDMHKHEQEVMAIEVSGLQNSCLDMLSRLKEWTTDERPCRYDVFNLISGTRVRKEPKGVALIIGAWNYPFVEVLEPMMCAIAAGCAVVVKPSEVAVASQNLLYEMITACLDQSAIRVVKAGAAEMNYVLDKRWNHIFFTGSTAIGKVIYAKAAAHLTTVTLELGGQAPAIVTAHADVQLAAKRIAAAKFLSAEQICVTVNHVFVDRTVRDEFIASLAKWFDVFYGRKLDKAGDGSEEADFYTHIVNDRNFARLDSLLQRTSGRIVYGGHRNPKTRCFTPTVVDGVLPSDALMSEELFGPILPIIEASVDEAIQHTAAREHPLALYAFTASAAERKRILDQTNSGGVTFNDCILHMAAKDAPFGGVGASGMGSYHGRYGFDQFTHKRTVVSVPGWLESVFAFRYAPYTDKKVAQMMSFIGAKSSVPFDRHGQLRVGWLKCLSDFCRSFFGRRKAKAK